METNLFVYIINHNTIRGYKTKTTTVDFLSAKYAINFVVSSLNKCLSTIKACLNPPESLQNSNPDSHSTMNPLELSP